MIIYFLSCTRAVLKLNGCYAGIVDLFERRIELAADEKPLAEIVPGDNSLPLNFFIDENFFSHPPEYADVYLTGGDAIIYIKRYPPKDNALKVLWQTRFCGNLITLYHQGAVQLSCEGESFELYDMDDAFAESEYREESVGGRPVLIIAAKGGLAVISESGKRVFINAAESYRCGDMLEITVNFETCAHVRAVCSFSYDGNSMKLEKSRTEELSAPPDDVIHFAFFESVLTRADYAAYLSDGLKDKAELLPSYLGDFVAVTVPPAKFYADHGAINAAGLVYPKGKNLFEVKYFAADVKGRRIENIYEAE